MLETWKKTLENLKMQKAADIINLHMTPEVPKILKKGDEAEEQRTAAIKGQKQQFELKIKNADLAMDFVREQIFDETVAKEADEKIKKAMTPKPKADPKLKHD